MSAAKKEPRGTGASDDPRPVKEVGQELWRRILLDTAEERLSGNQRFWRTLALLRTGSAVEAEASFALGSSSWKALRRSRLLHAEILMRRGRHREAEDALSALFPAVEARPKEAENWLMLAENIRNPSGAFISLLKRGRRESGHTGLGCKSGLEWRRAMSLPSNSEVFRNYLDWLNWEAGGAGRPEELERIAEESLACPGISGHGIRLLARFCLRAGLWRFFIAGLFAMATAAHRDPAGAWRRWHSLCPRDKRKELRLAMADYLRRHPDMELEDFLRQYG